jgi:hypothetical protein
MYKSLSNLLYSLEKFVYFELPRRNKYIDFLLDLLKGLFLMFISLLLLVILTFLFLYLNGFDYRHKAIMPSVTIVWCFAPVIGIFFSYFRSFQSKFDGKYIELNDFSISNHFFDIVFYSAFFLDLFM